MTPREIKCIGSLDIVNETKVIPISSDYQIYLFTRIFLGKPVPAFQANIYRFLTRQQISYLQKLKIPFDSDKKYANGLITCSKLNLEELTKLYLEILLVDISDKEINEFQDLEFLEEKTMYLTQLGSVVLPLRPISEYIDPNILKSDILPRIGELIYVNNLLEK